jgi:hypothetical protein
MLQRGRCLMGKPGGGEFRVTDVHFLEIFQPHKHRLAHTPRR